MRTWLVSMMGLAFALAPVWSFAGTETYAEKVAAGATVYADYCSNCHGEQLQNTSGGVTFDLRRLRPDERSRFVNSVLNGKSQMPPWRGVLSLEQIEFLWTYIRANVDR
jgi:mono/diheme cytochrome c family protein